MLAILHLLMPVSGCLSHINRRAVLDSTAAASAMLLASRPCHAAQILDLADELSAPASSSAADPFAPQPIAIEAVPAGSKPKKSKSGPYERIKELQSKGSLSDKERKELKRLKADEMCEMLGKGC